MSFPTRGPWKAEKDVTVIDEIRCVMIESESSLSWLAMVMIQPGSTEEEGRANARLMASAPDLLDALKMLTRDFNMTRMLMGQEGRDLAGGIVATCNAVIAKAEGRR